MRAPRWLAALGATLALMLLATACGNDPAAEDGGGSPTGVAEETEPASGGTEMATDAATDAATETSTETSTEASAETSIVPLEEVCQTEYADVQAPEDFSVRLVTDIGTVDDGTFNQYAFEGMQAAEDCFGIETDYIETANEADYEQNLNTVLADNPDVVVTVGFLLADATRQFAGENAEVNFIGIDQFQEDYGDNYSGVLFREDQGGFLAGAMAGLLTESNVVGVVGGREDVPPVVRLVNGYRRGAEYIAEQEGSEIQVLETYLPSFTDPAAGQSAAQQFLGEGADVIFGAGGQTGSGGIRTAAEAGNWAIGVDQDEYFTTFNGGKAPGAEMLATSAVKRVDLGVFSKIAEAVEGSFEPGIFTLEASNDGITYAPFHDADIPQEAATQIEDIRQGLADGSIDTGVDPVTGELLEG